MTLNQHCFLHSRLAKGKVTLWHLVVQTFPELRSSYLLEGPANSNFGYMYGLFSVKIT